MIRIGKIVAAHGLRGEVVLTHIIGESGWLRKDEVLFLELNKGSLIPFFVRSAKAASEEEYLVGLEDVENAEEAKKLIGRPVFVKEEIVAGKAGDSPLLWIGFNIVDKQKGSLGLIEDVLQTGHQWLGRITWNGKEVLIPLIEPMIIQVNVKNRFIRMDLPEGLLEI